MSIRWRFTMKSLHLTALAVALGVALVPSVASAKGPSEASIDGPGLSQTVPLSGDETGDALGEIIVSAGFVSAAFGQEPNLMRAERPRGELGPRYVITYVLPGPTGEDVLRQDVYPYAKPEPVTYTQPGQRFYGTEQTRGGWFVGLRGLKSTLVAAGLPARPPAGGDSSFPWPIVGTMTLLGALAAFAYGARIRRRQQPAGGPASA